MLRCNIYLLQSCISYFVFLYDLVSDDIVHILLTSCVIEFLSYLCAWFEMLKFIGYKGIRRLGEEG
jgi:hypothetical protein